MEGYQVMYNYYKYNKNKTINFIDHNKRNYIITISLYRFNLFQKTLILLNIIIYKLFNYLLTNIYIYKWNYNTLIYIIVGLNKKYNIIIFFLFGYLLQCFLLIELLKY